MADTTLEIVEQPPVAPDTTLGETSDSEPIKADQMNGVLVLSLLDKIIGAVDQIQMTQSQLESRQQEMENAVSNIQGELTKLTKSHATTSNTAGKLLEKMRKVSVNVKTVRHNLERQQAQVKKLESNESELLRRRNFKVMIYQDEVKLPTKLSISKSLKGTEKQEVEEEVPENENKEGVQIQLSSDEELEVEEIIEESRAERIKRSGMRKVDDIKKAFSKEKMEKTKVKTRENLEKTKVRTRENLEKTKQNLEKTRHNIEKKMTKFGTKIVTNERREKIKTSRDKLKKSFTPDHPVYARSKTAVYKVPPFTFYVKKIREGELEVEATEMVEVGGEGEEEEEEEEGEGMDLLRGESPDPHSLLQITEDNDVMLAERSDSD